MYTDSHNHTSIFSGDAHMTCGELLSSAKQKGIDAVVVTEHLELDFPHPVDKPMEFDIPSFFSAFQIWKKENDTGVDLRAGIEFGYQKHLAKEYDRIAASFPFDSIILSNHLFRGSDPFFFRECYRLDKETLFAEYLNELCEMVEHTDGFDIVGHYDYIARYAPLPMKMCYGDAPEAFDRFLHAVTAKNKSLEINTRSIYKLRCAGYTDALPDEAVIDAYYRAGGRRITLGSDSHDPSTVGLYFDEVAKLLKHAGFTYLTYYVGRKENHQNLL